MARGRMIGVLAIAATVALSGCGLLGGSSEEAGDTDWTVAPQTAPTSTVTSTTSTVPGSTERAATIELSEEDRRIIRVCEAIIEVQSAGVSLWEALDSNSGGLRSSATRINSAFAQLSDASDPGLRAQIEPVLTDLARLDGAADSAEMRQVAADVVERIGPRITAILSEIQPFCPGQLTPEDLDQAERVELDSSPNLD